MSSIRIDPVALDSNAYIHALRQTPGYAACSTLLFDRSPELHVHVPLQVIVELQKNLDSAEIARFYAIARESGAFDFDYRAASAELRAKFEARGARKGDAAIAAQLQAAGVRWLVSENRHFLAEIRDLPFTVLSAADALAMLDAPE